VKLVAGQCQPLVKVFDSHLVLNVQKLRRLYFSC